MKPRMLFITLLLFAELAVSITLGNLSPRGVASRLVMLAALLLPLLFLLRAPAIRVPLCFKPRPRSSSFFLLLPAFILLTASLSLLFSWLFSLLGISAEGVTPLSPFHAALLFDAALPALAEELFCRGAVYGTLRPMGRRIAHLGSALIFALMHGNLYQLPYAFAAGVLLSLLYEATGSLLFPIAFHFANNTASLMLGAFLNPTLFFIILGVLAPLLVLVFFLLPSRPRLPDEGITVTDTPYRDFFLSPILLYGAVMLTLMIF